jgi:hypothetical protein
MISAAISPITNAVEYVFCSYVSDESAIKRRFDTRTEPTLPGAMDTSSGTFVIPQHSV